MDALTVESIGIGSDGTYTVFYDDGDLFWGHVIIVSGSLDGGPDDTTIAG